MMSVPKGLVSFYPLGRPVGTQHDGSALWQWSADDIAVWPVEMASSLDFLSLPHSEVEVREHLGAAWSESVVKYLRQRKVCVRIEGTPEDRLQTVGDLTLVVGTPDADSSAKWDEQSGTAEVNGFEGAAIVSRTAWRVVEGFGGDVGAGLRSEATLTDEPLGAILDRFLNDVRILARRGAGFLSDAERSE